MRSTPNALVLVLLAATLAAPAALAQSSPGQMHQGGARHSGRYSAESVEQRISDLHAKLQITPDEEALWDKFARVMRDNAQQMRQSASERASKLKDMNASDNMQSYAQLAMLHAQDLQNLTAVFQPLYASLSPEQQRAADTMFRNVAMRYVASRRHQGLAVAAERVRQSPE
jgi:protein CpxP